MLLLGKARSKGIEGLRFVTFKACYRSTMQGDDEKRLITQYRQYIINNRTKRETYWIFSFDAKF